MLRLANGTLVPFEESYRLCGQCHGDKYRDWRAGVHGRRVGSWNGEKQYLLCVHCHDSPPAGLQAPRAHARAPPTGGAAMSADLTRRTFLCAVAGCAAAAAGGCGDVTHTAFFRKNFRDNTEEEVDALIAQSRAGRPGELRQAGDRRAPSPRSPA